MFHGIAQWADPGHPIVTTDGGLETTLVFQYQIALRDFASFELLRDEAGTGILRSWYRSFAGLAVQTGSHLLLDSPTWRASRDWGARLGYSQAELSAINRAGIALLEETRAEAGLGARLQISGCLGPRGDGYVPGQIMTVAEAQSYHGVQMEWLADSAADVLCAITINNVPEAAGIALAARQCSLPLVISFTVETDGRLPDGTSLSSAIAQVDEISDGRPAGYKINCAHPEHFRTELQEAGDWARRLLGLRCNASRRSHDELNESADLDDGNPNELASAMAEMQQRLPWLRVFGGCCGTDLRHITAIAAACACPEGKTKR
jgi:homocysteine S-methyltransferase